MIHSFDEVSYRPQPLPALLNSKGGFLFLKGEAICTKGAGAEGRAGLREELKKYSRVCDGIGCLRLLKRGLMGFFPSLTGMSSRIAWLFLLTYPILLQRLGIPEMFHLKPNQDICLLFDLRQKPIAIL